MQTFLPYKSFVHSARCLDDQRLNKQRSEARDILYLSLRHQGYDLRDDFKKTKLQAEKIWLQYQNHPTVKMWIEYDFFLVKYIMAVCSEWKLRKHHDTIQSKVLNIMKKNFQLFRKIRSPYWLGDEGFHKSHQSNLLRKNKEHYSKFFSVPDNIKYVWPTEINRL